jgi:hypothetical protein
MISEELRAIFAPTIAAFPKPRRGRSYGNIPLRSVNMCALIPPIMFQTYFECGCHTSICIPTPVEVLGKCCFWNPKVVSMTFGSESHLARIDELCFENCLLVSVCIPAG